MEFPIKKNDELTLSITGLNSEGAGVARHENVAVFVKNALAGESVHAHIIKVGKNYAVGKLMGILSASRERVSPVCPEYFRCGGCALQHLSYEAQLEFKRTKVKDAFKHIGGIDIDVRETIPMSQTPPMRFRNKASFPISIVDGRPRFGFFAERSHRLIPIDDCICVSEKSNAIAAAFTDFLYNKKISVYDEATHRGVARHIVIRTNDKGLAHVTIVSTVPMRHKAELVDCILKVAPDTVGIVNNINNGDGNTILGGEYISLYGEMKLPYELMGLKFMVHPASFLQVNCEQMIKLYDTAINYLDARHTDTVADVYSGIGTLSLLVAGNVKRVIGIENVPEAVKDARENAELNGIENAEYICEDAEKALPRLVSEGMSIDGAILDPPRRGLDMAVIDALKAANIARIVYISCNVGTLARDVKAFLEYGYSVELVQPVDMFGYSGHVETVCLLSRK